MKPHSTHPVVVIIGATGGLGAAIARAFAEPNYQLAFVARRPTALQDLASSLQAQTYAADLVSYPSLVQLRDQLMHDYGRIDLVINATGVDIRKPFESHTQDDINQSFAINTIGAINLTQVMLEAMTTGQIMHLGGFADGRLAFPFYSIDVASRAALRTAIESINRELVLQQRPIQVSYFSPSPADTVAERPYHALWRAMGTPIISVDQVAAAVRQAATHHRQLTIMGGALTRIFAAINAINPALADWLMMRRYGQLMQPYFAPNWPTPNQPNRRFGPTIGLILIILSVLAYVILATVPFLNLETPTKLALSSGLVIGSEIIFWIGGALVGKELVTRYRQYLNPCTWWACIRR